MNFGREYLTRYGGAVMDTTSLMLGASAVGSLYSAFAAKDAASTQAGAATQASNRAFDQAQQVRDDLAPYRGYGVAAGNDLSNRLAQLSSPFQPTQAQLEATPGYQFTLSQGLQGVQNSAAARGLGISGAALKGAAQFATGLADSTYKTQFDIDQANKTNSFNKLLQMTNLGQSSATNTGHIATAGIQNANNFATSGANALASGTIGGANAIQGGLNSGMNNYLMYSLLNRNAQTGGGTNQYGTTQKGAFL